LNEFDLSAIAKLNTTCECENIKVLLIILIFVKK